MIDLVLNVYGQLEYDAEGFHIHNCVSGLFNFWTKVLVSH